MTVSRVKQCPLAPWHVLQSPMTTTFNLVTVMPLRLRYNGSTGHLAAHSLWWWPYVYVQSTDRRSWVCLCCWSSFLLSLLGPEFQARRCIWWRQPRSCRWSPHVSGLSYNSPTCHGSARMASQLSYKYLAIINRTEYQCLTTVRSGEIGISEHEQTISSGNTNACSLHD